MKGDRKTNQSKVNGEGNWIMKKKIFRSNKIEEIIYVDLQVDELQMWVFFFLSTSSQVLFCLINITSKLEYC